MLISAPFGPQCGFLFHIGWFRYGGCHNETTVPCLPADGCHDGYKGAPALTFTGGEGTPIADEFIPPWWVPCVAPPPPVPFEGVGGC